MNDSDSSLAAVEPPRALNRRESAVLQRLLEQDFTGRRELREQARCLRVCAQATDGSHSVRFAAVAAPRSTGTLRVPVEGEAIDGDGTPIAVLLHVVDGLALELEIYRVDFEPIRTDDYAGSLTAVGIDVAE